MIVLQQRPRADIPIDRQWLVFFGEGEQPAWWARFLKPGFRHVWACAWYDDAERWVYVNPTRRGTTIRIYRDDEFGPRMSHMLATSALILRVRSQQQRTATPFGWWCTGAIKALLGVRAGALSPRGLADHLLRNGAETVRPPQESYVEPIQFGPAAAGDGRPCSEAVAGGGAPPG